MGIRDRLISPGSPWQNAYVERLIGTVRRECRLPEQPAEKGFKGSTVAIGDTAMKRDVAVRPNQQ